MKQYNKYLYDKLYNVMSNNNNLTYDKLEMIMQLNNVEQSTQYEYLKNIYDCNYYFTKVKSIEYGEHHVYDFHLPQTHSFVSNGIVSHNTFDEVLAMFITAIRYPDIELAMTAQTKENASELLKDKTYEIIKYYPLLENELVGGSLREGTRFSKNDAEVRFKSGARIDILANAQSSKGQRRKRINIEESALLNNELFQDALAPIVEVPRFTTGKCSVVNPEENNGSINFFTTSGYRGSDEFQRSLDMVNSMAKLDGKMVLGSSWFLACWYGRGSTKSQILEKKKSMSPTAFGMNYESNWIGASDGALININKLLNCRNLNKPLIKTNNVEDEFILGVDVARSEKTANNQSSVAVLKIIRDKSGRIKKLELVNTIHIDNTANFTKQAIEIKRIKRDFNAQIVVVDGNGLGAGLVDELLKNCIDPITDEDLGCWNTINTDNQPEDIRNCETIVFDMKAQSVQSKVITRFIDVVDSGILRLLVNKRDTDFTQKDMDDYNLKVLPYIQTDFLIEEISNLQLKQNNNGTLSVHKIVRKIDKDRWSALAYAIYYAMEYIEVVSTDSQTQLDTMYDYLFL